MEIIRGEHESHFTIVANEVMRDQRLSFKARGIHHFILSFPSGWRISATSISRAGREGRDAVLAGLKELEQFGYLHRERQQDDKGRWSTRVVVTEQPRTDYPSSGEPKSGEPTVGDSGSITKTEIVKNVKKDIDKDSLPSVVASEWWEAYKARHDGKTPIGKRAWFALRSVVIAAVDSGWSVDDVRVALAKHDFVPSIGQLERSLTGSGARRTAGEDRLHRDLELLANVALSANKRAIPGGDDGSK